MTEDRALTVIEGALAIPDASTFRRQLMAIHQFQAIAHAALVEGHDYGTIPGTPKPSLWKSGAEKISKILGLADKYEILDKVEDWDRPLFRYLIKCRLESIAHTVTVAEGLGECNSMEAKYHWRERRRVCPNCGAEAIIKGKQEFGGGWLCFLKKGGCGAKWPDGAEVIEGQPTGKVENEDIYSLVNTILKMAKKRALVDAALSAGRLSDIFTQDLEDRAQEETEHTGGVSEPKGVVSHDTNPAGSSTTPKTSQPPLAPVPPVRPQEAPPKPEHTRAEMERCWDAVTALGGTPLDFLAFLSVKHFNEVLDIGQALAYYAKAKGKPAPEWKGE